MWTANKHIELGAAISQAIQAAVEHANSSDAPGFALCDCFRDHIKKRHPSQTHWHIDQVQLERTSPTRDGLEAELAINIPGAGRAYHDVDIYPVEATWLTIPNADYQPHSGRWGAWSYADLFKPANLDVLALRSEAPGPGEQGLNIVFSLCKHVHQAQTPEEMPEDGDAARSLTDAWFKQFDSELGNQLGSM